MRANWIAGGTAALLLLLVGLPMSAAAAEPEFGGSCAMGLAEGKRKRRF